MTASNQKQEFVLTSILPYTGTLLVFLGVLRLWTYFEVFNISILSYLEFSEIITSFLDINIILTFLLVPLTLFSMNHLIPAKKKNNLKNISLKLINIIALGTIVICFIVSRIIADNQVDLYFYLFFGCTIVAGLYYFVYSIKIYRSLLPRTAAQWILIFFPFLFITISVSFYEASNVVNDKLYYGTTIRVGEGQALNLDRENYFIGKTNGYLFVYHENDSSTDIFPIKEIKLITIRKQKRLF